jgi:hypothetical protein
VEETMAVDQTLVDEIVRLEWEMFSNVQSMDGPVSCQQSPKTFEIMRSSQTKSWNDEVAASYLDDLHTAEAQGRNLMTEKYARMMQYTSPCEFRRIEGQLPQVEPEAEGVVERLTRKLVEWQEELAAQYPYVAGQGRPIRSTDDNRYITSFESYNRGELATYSLRTLGLLEQHYRALAAAGENPAEAVLRNTVERYGYKSVERAEEAQRARVEEARAGN